MRGRSFGVRGIHLGRHGAPADQLVDPLAKAAMVLEVMFGAGLTDPPRRLVGLLAERVPLLDHPRAPGVRLGPGDVPWLVAHRLPEGRVEGVDVDVMTRIGPSVQPFELDLRLGEPRAEMRGQVAHGPVWVDVVAGHHALLGRQRAHESSKLVPAPELRLKLRKIRVTRARPRNLRVGTRALPPHRQAGLVTTEPWR